MQLLCQLDAITDGQAKGLEIGDLSLLLVRQGKKVFAYRNSCPHLGIPLEWAPDQFMSLDGSHLQCAMHGALFLPHNGYCVWGPCSGKQLAPVAIHQDGEAIYLCDPAA